MAGKQFVAPYGGFPVLDEKTHVVSFRLAKEEVCLIVGVNYKSMSAGIYYLRISCEHGDGIVHYGGKSTIKD
ncbi:hypothetical protein [Andreprevotia sp. IGB-42]|uniref:hypothetical protein n=1 Tax=Andreprevotia sp. IGB-42 TaxID=2497473 RepID=UPI00135C3DF2|nr:hypothetical protein [Andreprevotia sp. IGB-42]